MTSAPLSQQRLLIDLQSLDSRLARLRHERKHLPVLSRIKDTVERLKANRREAALADGALAEARKGAARSEDEVDQVTRRAAILLERLTQLFCFSQKSTIFATVKNSYDRQLLSKLRISDCKEEFYDENKKDDIFILVQGKKTKKYDHQSHYSQRIPTFRRDFLYYLSVRASFRGSRKMRSR